MQKSEIQPKTEYAIREKRRLGTPLQRVRVIEHVRRNKWKVVWIDPNPGLIDYVESGQFLVPWWEHKALLREESSAQSLKEHNLRRGYKGDESPIVTALEQIFSSAGDGVEFMKGSVTGTPDSIARLRSRAGLPVDLEPPPAYVDRRGDLHLPFDVALEFGRKFCAAEPVTVLTVIEVTERKWTQEVERGADYLVELLNQYRASWALIRQWASLDAAIAQKEAEIQRLERLVWDAIYALQKAKQDSESARLRRALLRH
jgi:hypothetical protein